MQYVLQEDGIHDPLTTIQHRDDDHPEVCFATLLAMQERHFWYHGQHRFLLHALDRRRPRNGDPLAAIDSYSLSA